MTPGHPLPLLLLAPLLLPLAARGGDVDGALPAAGIPVRPTAPSAQPGPDGGTGWHASLGVGTDFPAAVSGRFVIEAPFRGRLSTSLGFMPGPYVDAINGTVVALGGYDERTGDLVRAALQSSLVWRTHVGYRAWRGLYVEAGYGLVLLGGAAAGSDVIAAVTGQSLPASVEAARPFRIDATLHMADVEVGYDFHLSPRWQLRAALGGAFTFAASTRIEADYQLAPSEVVDQFARGAEAYLEDVFTSYAFTPVVSVSVAYELF